MAIMERCSCCTVMTCSIGLGALMLVLTVYSIGTEARFMQCDFALWEDLSPEQKRAIDQSAPQCEVMEWMDGPYGMSQQQMETFRDFYIYLSIAKVVVFFFSIIFYSLLIYTKFSYVPMLTVIPLDFVIRLILVIIHTNMLAFFSNPLAVEMNIPLIISMIIDIFIWICIYSYHQQLPEVPNGDSDNEMKPV